MKFQRFLGATAIVGILATLPTAASAAKDGKSATPMVVSSQSSSQTGDLAPQSTESQNAAAPTQTTSEATQENNPTAAQVTAGTGGDIVVTGSRIRRPDLESTVPIATVKGEDVYNQANVNLGETLNNLPQLRSTFAQQNGGTSTIGVAGLNLLDLRGLGVQRTLVLVNGRRQVPSDIQNTAAAVDINTIPEDLIDRIDIVTGGNSAVYGSDAIAGVVNFVLKDHFQGLQIRAGDAIPEFGAGGNRYVSVLAGKNFADGRGNIAVAGEYSKQDRVFASQIPFLRQNNGFYTNDVDLGGGSDGIPDTVFGRDLRSTTIARYGLIPIAETRNSAAPCGTGVNGTNYNCNYIFSSLGDLMPITGERKGNGPNGNYIGGNGDTGREDRQVSVMPYNQRLSGTIIGHYDFSKAATVFLEGSYARVHTIGANSGPAFDQGAGVTFADDRAEFRLDNPFLTSAQRATIANAILASGSTTGLTGGRALTADDRAAIADGSFRFVDARNLTDLGIRDENTIRQTYSITLGLRGDITSHVNYELSGNYGRTTQDIKILGNVNVQRLLLAFDAGIDPATGKIACRSQFDPASANPVTDVDSPAAEAELANDIAQCVPYNPFGAADNTAARNYIVSNAGDHGRLSQIDAIGFVSADSGGFFNLPGGPVAIVLGGEFRQEDAKFVADPEIENGLTFLNALQTFDPPTERVTEGFGELNLPILKDIPFFKSLSLSGAVRVSHYNKAYGSTGTVVAYNGGGEWAPIQDVRFRANYGKAIRAPNYTDTAAPLGQNFAPGFQDPCNATRINTGTSERVANCEAAIPAAALAPGSAFQNFTNGSYSLEILSGSNPLLKAETSKSLTVGAVITPRFLPGFDVTVDYFDINVKNVIESASAQDIVDLCYDHGEFCNLFQRYTGTGTGPNGEVPGQILQGSLIQAGLNFASLRRRGLDVQLNYNHSIGNNASLNVRGYYTHQFENSDFTDPNDPTYETRNLNQLGDPKDEFVGNADLTLGKFTVGYGLHYIGPQLTTAYANLYPINGEPAQNPDVISITRYPAVLYHNVRFAVQLGSTASNRRGFEFFFGIDNFTNKNPPLGLTGTGDGSGIYEVLGRQYYSGIRLTF